MIADLKPYAEYKESGAPWFGDVPSHWNVGRLGAVFAERGETNERKQVTDVLSLLKDIGVIPYAEKGRIGNKKSDDIGRYKIVRPDDLVLNSMNVIIGSVGASRYTGCLSPVYYVLRRRDKENLPRFLELVFQHKAFQRSLVRIGNGILAHRMRIPMEKLKAELFPSPPPAEQAAIVRFLDWANGRLERAIRAKRKVIALLGEQKQAIIHRAVTRGLDPSVPLKPSGIPWLGEIPQHWEVWPLRRCISIRSGDFADPLHLRAERSDPHCIPVVGGNGVMGFTDRSNNGGTTIVIGRVGALCGNVHLIDGEAWVTDNALRITRITGFVARYLAHQLRVMDLNRLANANAQPLVTGGIIKSQRVTKPPEDEQNQIADRLVDLILPTTTAISRLEREIELLREYRTRLVADVVTGKLDVREAALRLPDEAPPDIVADDADLGDETEAEAAEEEAAV